MMQKDPDVQYVLSPEPFGNVPGRLVHLLDTCLISMQEHGHQNRVSADVLRDSLADDHDVIGSERTIGQLKGF